MMPSPELPSKQAESTESSGQYPGVTNVASSYVGAGVMVGAPDGMLEALTGSVLGTDEMEGTKLTLGIIEGMKVGSRPEDPKL